MQAFTKLRKGITVAAMASVVGSAIGSRLLIPVLLRSIVRAFLIEEQKIVKSVLRSRKAAAKGALVVVCCPMFLLAACSPSCCVAVSSRER